MQFYKALIIETVGDDGKPNGVRLSGTYFADEAAAIDRYGWRFVKLDYEKSIDVPDVYLTANKSNPALNELIESHPMAPIEEIPLTATIEVSAENSLIEEMQKRIRDGIKNVDHKKLAKLMQFIDLQTDLEIANIGIMLENPAMIRKLPDGDFKENLSLMVQILSNQ